MPKISITLPETSQAISRPVVIDIVNQVKAVTKIPADTPIFFPGDSERMRTAGSELNSESDRFASFETNRMVFIEVEEDHNVDAIATSSVNGYGAQPVFLDKDLGVSVCPVYTQTDLRITMRYRTHSKTEAIRWRDDMRLRVSQMRDMNTHVIKYHYLLPAEVLILLKDIYTHRENVLPYNDGFVNYFKSKSTDRLTLIGDLVGKDARIGIAETQTRVFGYYDFEPIPDKPEKDNDKGVWTIALVYKLTYDKPYVCHMRYPIMVHNQLLPFAYTAFTDSSVDLNKMVLSFQGSLFAMRSFESDVTLNAVKDPNAYIKLPDFDDYVIPQVMPGTGTILMALTSVEEDNKTLLNLKELDPIVLDQDVIDWLVEEEYQYICQRYRSVIQVHLYRNNTLVQNVNLISDSNLNIRALTDLNLRNQHRIRLSLVTDLSYLDTDALKRLRRRPKAFVKLIGAMNEVLKNHPDFNNLGDVNRITDFQFSQIYRILTGFQPGNNNHLSNLGREHYASGLQANYNPSPGNVNSLFGNLDPVMVENYRRNRVGFNTVQVTGIVTIMDNNLNE
jgi:hypothetical protein